jgi:hypothetical protein
VARADTRVAGRMAARRGPTRAALLAALAAAALFATALSPPTAEAHGLAGRADLPVPSWLFGWTVAVVLVISFMALAALWPKPRLQQRSRSRLLRIPVAVDVVCALTGLGLFVLVVYSGLAGTSQTTANLAPTFIYVDFWVGLVIASVLFGDVFRAFNPWLAVARAGSWMTRRVLGRAPLRPLDYPAWLGRWPAVVGILCFAWLELAYVNKGDPHRLAALALIYAGVQLVAMVLFGVERWSRNGDAFGVYYNLYSHLSAFEREGQTLYVRRPLSGVPALPMVAGSVALLCVAIGSTTFDGFSNGPLWASIERQLESFFTHLGAGATNAFQWSATVGLVSCVLAMGLFYRLGVRGMQTVGEGGSARELAVRFAHTLVPIAFAYALAHYFSLLVFQGQADRYLISDPLGDGANLFGTASATINYHLVSTNMIWYVQVGALACGHVTGLVLAHDRAVSLYHKVQDATRSQYWMLVVMVGYTSLGLWLLSAVNQ